MAEHGTLKVEVRRRLDRDLHCNDLEIEKYQIIFAKSKELGTHASGVPLREAGCTPEACVPGDLPPRRLRQLIPPYYPANTLFSISL